MRRVMGYTAALVTAIVALPIQSWAYVDPGTGSAVFGAAAYALAAGGAALAFVIGLLRKFGFALFRSKRNGSGDEETS